VFSGTRGSNMKTIIDTLNNLSPNNIKPGVEDELLVLANKGDVGALFHLGITAWMDKRYGFAKVFLTLADQRHHPEAKYYLSLVDKDIYEHL